MKRLLLTALLFISSGNAVAGIGISFDQTMQYFGKSFKMKKESSVRGEDRYMGMTSDNLATLEIIGQKNDISQASLIIGIPNDSPAKAARNTAILLRFLKNTVPEWDGSSDWMTSAIQEFANGREKSSIIKGRKLITMQFAKSLGWIIATVKEK